MRREERRGGDKNRGARAPRPFSRTPRPLGSNLIFKPDREAFLKKVDAYLDKAFGK